MTPQKLANCHRALLRAKSAAFLRWLSGANTRKPYGALAAVPRVKISSFSTEAIASWKRRSIGPVFVCLVEFVILLPAWFRLRDVLVECLRSANCVRFYDNIASPIIARGDAAERVPVEFHLSG